MTDAGICMYPVLVLYWLCLRYVCVAWVYWLTILSLGTDIDFFFFFFVDSYSSQSICVTTKCTALIRVGMFQVYSFLSHDVPCSRSARLHAGLGRVPVRVRVRCKHDVGFRDGTARRAWAWSIGMVGWTSGHAARIIFWDVFCSISTRVDTEMVPGLWILLW